MASGETRTNLSPEQNARAEALEKARYVLAARSTGFSSGAVDAMDMHNLATFILTGEDPWERIKIKEPDDGTR